MIFIYMAVFVFSLVELIIVIAIMAILVGVVAATVIPYMEKSRKAKDQQQLSSITTSAVSAISDAEKTVQAFKDRGYTELIGASKVDGGPSADTTDVYSGSVVITELYELMNKQDEGQIIDKFKSKAFTEKNFASGDDGKSKPSPNAILISYGGQYGIGSGGTVLTTDGEASYLKKGQVITYIKGVEQQDGKAFYKR